LQDRNETLFYALLARHVEEMTPIIYTPTVGKACQEFSHRYQKARGLYITPKNVDDMGSLARQLDAKSVRIIVVTDSQGSWGSVTRGWAAWAFPSASSPSIPWLPAFTRLLPAHRAGRGHRQSGAAG
jgi:malate dehydrogenase (oxaloacetate-decarboxylating)